MHSKLLRWLTSLTAVICVFYVVAAEADQTVTYKFVAYGERHVHIILSGASVSDISPTLSADGRSIRISGVGINFTSDAGANLPQLVTLANVVKSGAYTDLVINVAVPVEISTSSTPNSLRVLVKRRAEGQTASTTPSAASTPRATPSVTVLKHKVSPFTVVQDFDESKVGGAKSAGFKLLFPPFSGMEPTSSLSATLRKAAYALDILWTWTTSGSIAYAGKSAMADATSVEKSETDELKNLVKELTDELISVRKDLANREELLRTCNSAAVPTAEATPSTIQ